MVPTTTAAESLWLAGRAGPSFPVPGTERAFDVLVLGGGITGAGRRPSCPTGLSTRSTSPTSGSGAAPRPLRPCRLPHHGGQPAAAHPGHPSPAEVLILLMAPEFGLHHVQAMPLDSNSLRHPQVDRPLRIASRVPVAASTVHQVLRRHDRPVLAAWTAPPGNRYAATNGPAPRTRPRRRKSSAGTPTAAGTAPWDVQPPAPTRPASADTVPCSRPRSR
jgi:hypothetical protein